MLVTLGGQGLKTKFQTQPAWYNKTLRKKRMIAIYDLKYVKKIVLSNISNQHYVVKCSLIPDKTPR